MDGEDLSVLFDGRRPPDRPWFTSCYDNYVLAGRPRLVLHLGQRGPPEAPLRQAAPTRASCATWPPSTRRSWTGSGRCSRTRPAARCPSSRRLGSEGGDRRVRLTRRGLLRHGGAGAATAAALAGLAAGRAGSGSRARGRRDARCSWCCRWCAPTTWSAFKDGEGADTPNLDDLTGRLAALRPRDPRVHAGAAGAAHADHRDALVPVPRLEAHRRHAGRARLQPGLGLAARDDRGDARRRREGGLRDRQPDRVRAALPRGAPSRRRAGARAGLPRTASTARSPPSSAPRDATERTFAAGIAALGEVKDEDSFFVAVDPFDPVDAIAAPPIYVRPGVVEHDGIGPMSERLVELDFSDGDTEAAALRLPRPRGGGGRLGRPAAGRGARRHARVRARRHRHTRSATTRSSAAARPPPTAASYEIPYLIRHPDGDEGRRQRGLVRLHPRRAHHAARPPRPHDPGQDARRGPDARCSTTWTRTTCPTGPSRSPRAAS